ncbi:hypothetical protein SESBI_45917 [Sesbania bispinosa]|nr:hypothetical protein SESBI_45917 [Sesbania bispinosa]
MYMYSFVSFTNGYRAASLADSSPASVPLQFRVEPKPKSGIRQQDLLKKVVEIKPKRPRSDSSNQLTPASSDAPVTNRKPDHGPLKQNEQTLSGSKKMEEQSLSGSKKVEEHPSSGSHEVDPKPKIDNSADSQCKFSIIIDNLR